MKVKFIKNVKKIFVLKSMWVTPPSSISIVRLEACRLDEDLIIRAYLKVAGRSGGIYTSWCYANNVPAEIRDIVKNAEWIRKKRSRHAGRVHKVQPS